MIRVDLRGPFGSDARLAISSMAVLGTHLLAPTLQGTFARMFELFHDRLMFGVRDSLESVLCVWVTWSCCRETGTLRHGTETASHLASQPISLRLFYLFVSCVPPALTCQIRPELPSGEFGEEFRWQTYGQVESRVAHFTRGLDARLRTRYGCVATSPRAVLLLTACSCGACVRACVCVCLA